MTPTVRRLIGEGMSRRERALEGLRNRQRELEDELQVVKNEIARVEGEQADLRAAL